MKMKHGKKFTLIALSVVCVALSLLVSLVLIPDGGYDTAVSRTDGVRVSEEKPGSAASTKDTQYDAAIALMEMGSYEEAIASFEALNGYRDSEEQILKCKYEVAEATLAAGDRCGAAARFGSLNYLDSMQRSEALWEEIAVHETISAGLHTVSLSADGTVFAAGGDSFDQCDVSG